MRLGQEESERRFEGIIREAQSSQELVQQLNREIESIHENSRAIQSYSLELDPQIKNQQLQISELSEKVRKIQASNDQHQVEELEKIHSIEERINRWRQNSPRQPE